MKKIDYGSNRVVYNIFHLTHLLSSYQINVCADSYYPV